ncbi:CHAP domain-containing protein [bacterium]|nr:CHAP domain-containing protein [bacterium]
MDINLLKLGFASYLEAKNAENNTEEQYVVENSDASIFVYSDEFKDYLAETLNITEDVGSISIDEILNMEISNGQLIPQDENSENISSFPMSENEIVIGSEGNGNGENLQEQITLLEQQQALFTGILNELLTDENVQGFIDTNGDTTISEEEITAFLQAVSAQDGNAEDISLEDIFGAIESMKENTFEIPSAEEQKIETTQETKNPETVQQPSTNNNGGNYQSYTPSSNGTQVQEKSLDSMTRDELNTELATTQGTLATQQSELSNILNGSTEELQSLQENIDTAYETYQTELAKVDGEMAQQLDDIETRLDAKQAEVDAKEQAIFDQENTVSSCKNTYDNAVATTSNLESILSGLESTDTSELTEEQQANLNSKIQSTKEQLQEAKDAEEEAKTAWEESETKLNTLKEEKTTLDTELSEIQTEKTDFEALLSQKYPEIEQYMTAYNDAKEAYKTAQDTAANAVRTEITQTQNYINNINTAISTVGQKEDIKENYFGAFGDDIVAFANQFIGANEADGSADKFLASWTTSAETPWCAAFVEYVMENSGSYEQLPDWYKDIDNKWYCPNIDNAAEKAGAVINGDEAKAGDIVLFDWDGDGKMDHVGIVVSNENGKLVTIEGNTSNKVAQKEYETDDPRIKYCKTT